MLPLKHVQYRICTRLFRQRKINTKDSPLPQTFSPHLLLAIDSQRPTNEESFTVANDFSEAKHHEQVCHHTVNVEAAVEASRLILAPVKKKKEKEISVPWEIVRHQCVSDKRKVRGFWGECRGL